MTDIDVTPDADAYGHPLANVPAPGPWVRLGRCRTVPHSLFFPERGDDVSQAKNVCRHCPVVADCAAYALAAGPDLRGVWGGLSENERRRHRSTVAVDTREEPEAAAPVASAAEDGSLFAVLEQLANYPGVWAKVGRYHSAGSATTTASLLRNGRRLVPPGNWEFEGRRNPTGGSDLYARRLADDDQVAS